MENIRIPSKSWRLLKVLAGEAQMRQLPLYAVGGCVRDWILKRPTLDLDLVAEGDPAPLARLCAKLLKSEAKPFGRFGTWRVHTKGGLRVDFAACRRESYPHPASLPEVEPASLREDLFRRDFTINAMAVPLLVPGPGQVVDVYGGLRDLKAGVLRPLHPMSFCDDPTRVFRAARFLCRFSLKPAQGLAVMARTSLARGHAARLSRHRLLQELLRVLAEKDPRCALEQLKKWGYLQLIHPKLKWRPTALKEPEERLGVLLFGLGADEGRKLLESLPLERPVAQALAEALEISKLRMSPRRALPRLSARVLSSAHRDLPAAALKPLWISGRDLMALGLPSGAAYREILDRAARAQWSGRLPSRQSALKWLKSVAAGGKNGR